jgi:hypothetical protein
MFIADEIYHGLTYGEPAHTACQKMYLSSTAFQNTQHDGVAPRQARFAALLNRRA